MAIKETPTNVKTYYKLAIESFKKQLEEAIKIKDKLELQSKEYRAEILTNHELYESNFNVHLTKFEEFVDNKYIDGKFLKTAKGLFINRSNNYELVSELFDLYNFARLQKQIYDINEDISLYRRISVLTLKQYTEILRAYYTEVHKHMILEGTGYAFGQSIGWICINRCILRKPSPHIDYAATRRKEAELKAKGVRIYNKEEADWCAKNGIEYKAEDKRVFTTNEYCYQIPLLGCKLPNGSKFKLEISDYRHADYRGLTNDQLIEKCNGDLNKICELKVDLKTKLTLCDKTDKILYTKFIRNENQEPALSSKINRKDRQ